MPSKVKKRDFGLNRCWVFFFTFNSFYNALSQVHALLTDVTASQVECKVWAPPINDIKESTMHPHQIKCNTLF